jgi:hypothetical protein
MKIQLKLKQRLAFHLDKILKLLKKLKMFQIRKSIREKKVKDLDVDLVLLSKISMNQCLALKESLANLQEPQEAEIGPEMKLILKSNQLKKYYTIIHQDLERVLRGERKETVKKVEKEEKEQILEEEWQSDSDLDMNELAEIRSVVEKRKNRRGQQARRA